MQGTGQLQESTATSLALQSLWHSESQAQFTQSVTPQLAGAMLICRRQQGSCAESTAKQSCASLSENKALMIVIRVITTGETVNPQRCNGA